LRDAHAKFEDHGVKVYAISYDDQETLKEFGREQGIPYPLLSDVDSTVIRDYGILNSEVSSDDAFLYGIPFPGTYVADETGKIVAKFFHDSYKKRDSPESLLDAALGRIVLDEESPQVVGGGDDVKITAAVHGGKGTLRQGIMRKLVVRFELAEGLHIYSDPVPEGMVATTISVEGPPGFRPLEPVFPPAKNLHLKSMNVDLQVWSGTVDIAIPFYATGELASETRPLDMPEAEIGIRVRYQACTDNACLLPATEEMVLSLALDVVDVPALSVHMGHGQREGSYSSMPAMRRLILRKGKKNPFGFLKYLAKMVRLERAARKRRG